MSPTKALCAAFFSSAALLGCAATATPGDGSVAHDGAVDAPAVDAPGDRGVPTDLPRGTCETEPVTDVPSRATVRFRFRGTSGWLATQGRYCSAMVIERVGGGVVPRVSGAGCLCECAAPPPPSVSQVRALDGAQELTWDGRGLVSCTVAVDCATRGWPGVGVQFEHRLAMQPVAAGRYRASFATYTEAPFNCRGDADAGTLDCGAPAGPPMLGQSGDALCSADGNLSVEFDLPATGEVVVDVP